MKPISKEIWNVSSFYVPEKSFVLKFSVQQSKIYHEHEKRCLIFPNGKINVMFEDWSLFADSTWNFDGDTCTNSLQSQICFRRLLIGPRTLVNWALIFKKLPPILSRQHWIISNITDFGFLALIENIIEHEIRIWLSKSAFLLSPQSSFFLKVFFSFSSKLFCVN